MALSFLKKVKLDLQVLSTEIVNETNIDEVCDRAINLVEALYQKRLDLAWGPGVISPEHFEHRIDQFLWRNRNSFWVERGVFNNITISSNAKVLELSCGDGFFAHHFYSQLAKSCECVDIDKDAINYSKKYHSSRGNIQYYCEDINTYIPKNTYNNIIWDAAIEHFSPENIDSLVKKYSQFLETDGIFSGYTLQEKDTGVLQHADHLCEMRDKEHLAKFFTPYFKNVLILETIHSERVNYHFFASNGPIPFTHIDNSKYMFIQTASK